MCLHLHVKLSMGGRGGLLALQKRPHNLVAPNALVYIATSQKGMAFNSTDTKCGRFFFVFLGVVHTHPSRFWPALASYGGGRGEGAGREASKNLAEVSRGLDHPPSLCTFTSNGKAMLFVIYQKGKCWVGCRSMSSLACASCVPPSAHEALFLLHAAALDTRSMALVAMRRPLYAVLPLRRVLHMPSPLPSICHKPRALWHPSQATILPSYH